MSTACRKHRYRPCSFKGVPCIAVEATSEHGRRGAEAEFPFGERNAYQDMGLALRTFSITARFEGARHLADAAAFIAACESPGPGPLMHPTRGLIPSVACKKVTVRNNVETELGVTNVDAQFVEAPLWREQGPLGNQLLQLGISTIIGIARGHLASFFVPGSFQPFRRREAGDAARAALTATRNAVSSAIDPWSDRASAGLARAVDSVLTPSLIPPDATALDAAMHGVMRAAAATVRGSVKTAVFRDVANALAEVPNIPGRAGQGVAAVHSAGRTMAAAWMAQGILEASLSPASVMRSGAASVSAILSEEEQHALDLGDRRYFLALREFRVNAASRIGAAAESAPERIAVHAGPAHPLAAAYALLGDARRHREIEALNCVSGEGRTGRTITVSV